MALRNTHVSHNKLQSFKYDYSKFDEDKFLDDFHQIDFTYLENSDLDVNNKFDRFLKDLQTLTHQHASVRGRVERKLNSKINHG